MSDIINLITSFIDSLPNNFEKIDNEKTYNEFSLQHELGIFLRRKLPDYLVQFERNTDFFGIKHKLTKKEIDISIFSRDFSPDKPDKNKLKCAIELKYPRNGQYPEQMFSFCKDIKFIEQLRDEGFDSAALIIFANDKLFYSGDSSGIYGYFRNKKLLHGNIIKPTGNKDDQVFISGHYKAEWKIIVDSLKYVVIEAANAI